MGACWFLWTDFVSQLLQKDYLVIQHVCFFFFFFQITSQNFSPIREKVPTNSTKRCHFCYIHIHWFRFSSVRYLLKSNLCDRIGIRFVKLITNVKVPSYVYLSWLMWLSHDIMANWRHGIGGNTRILIRERVSINLRDVGTMNVLLLLHTYWSQF